MSGLKNKLVSLRNSLINVFPVHSDFTNISSAHFKDAIVFLYENRKLIQSVGQQVTNSAQAHSLHLSMLDRNLFVSVSSTIPQIIQ